jgi:methionine aminopeptidase
MYHLTSSPQSDRALDHWQWISIIRRLAQEAGYGSVPEFTGHGIGAEFHMFPPIYHVGMKQLNIRGFVDQDFFQYTVVCDSFVFS